MALKTESIGPLERLFSVLDSRTVPSIFLSFRSATAPQEDPDEVSRAIGKGGYNIRLAGKLTGYEIDVYREGAEEDVELREFSDEIDDWVIEEFRKVGLDTAKSILELEAEDLIKRTDLEEETVMDVLKILKEEFED